MEAILRQVAAPESGWRIAAAFCSSTWYTGETNKLLNENEASLVMHDIPKSRNTFVNKKTDFIYLRFHGPAGNYRGTYGNHYIPAKAAEIKRYIKSCKDVYACFNNTTGSAFENAII